MTVKIGDRWSIIGASGSGKTVLSKKLMEFLMSASQWKIPITIFDTKVMNDFKEYEKRKDLSTVVKTNDPDKVLAVRDKKPFTIWQPEKDDLAMYEYYFAIAYQKARKSKLPAVIYLDELANICTQLGRAPDHYDILLKQGRGMNNGLISVTQSPSFIPQNLIRQSTHMIRMNLNDEYDVKKLVRAMGKEVIDPPEDEHGFWYRNCSRPARLSPPSYYSDVKDFI